MSSIPTEIPTDLSPGELERLVTALSNEVMLKSQMVASYEISFKMADKEYKRALARAVVMNRGEGTPTIVKSMAEASPAVVVAADKLQADEAIYIMGKAELEGREAQYQAAKQVLQLKIQELRSLR